MIVIAYFSSPITRQPATIVKFDDSDATKYNAKTFLEIGLGTIADVARYQGPTSSVWMVPGTE